MSWTLYEPQYRKVIKAFDNPIEAAKYCSDHELMQKILEDLKPWLASPQVYGPPDFSLHDDEHNWSFHFDSFLNGHWFEAARDPEPEWIEPELQHKMFEILNNMETTEFVPFDKRPEINPDTYEYPF